MPVSIADTLRSVDRLLEEAVTAASHAAMSENREHGQAMAARAVHACNNARQLVIYMQEMMEDEKRKDAV